jgi:hypothetical protein
MPNQVTLGLSLAGVALLEVFYAGCIWSMLKHRKRLLVNARSPILAAVQGLTIMPFSGTILVQVNCAVDALIVVHHFKGLLLFFSQVLCHLPAATHCGTSQRCDYKDPDA